VDWPHSPAHRLTEAGAYIVTAGTYCKEPIFRSAPRLDLLQRHLHALAEQYFLTLQAWAIFPNHYHFIAEVTKGSQPLHLLRHLHSLTAREVNRMDQKPGRKVWFQYWDTRLTNQKSYFARLRYVHENAAHHRIVRVASEYPWCSAGWFEQKATAAFRNTILAFPCDQIALPDDFQVAPEEVRAI
jgi:putative transposase